MLVSDNAIVVWGWRHFGRTVRTKKLRMVGTGITEKGVPWGLVVWFPIRTIGAVT